MSTTTRWDKSSINTELLSVATQLMKCVTKMCPQDDGAHQEWVEDSAQVNTRRVEQEQVDFSKINEDDLRRLGVEQKWMRLNRSTLALQSKALDSSAAFRGLLGKVSAVFGRVCMDFLKGRRVLVTEILLGLLDIVPTNGQTSLAFLPGKKVGKFADSVLVTNPETGSWMSLCGSIDHTIIEYPNDQDGANRGRIIHAGEWGAEKVFQLGTGRLVLVEADTLDLFEFPSYIPKAVGQAIAVLKLSGASTVRFCLTNGVVWQFFALVEAPNGKLTFYESERYLLKHCCGVHDEGLKNVICMLLGCLRRSDIFYPDQ